MTVDLPEPFRSMSPTDPRRREYERSAVPPGPTTAELAWQAGDLVYFEVAAVATTKSTLDSSTPSTLSSVASPAGLIQAVERVGWHLDSVQYVHAEGTSSSLGVGVRLTGGAVFAMMLFRRTET